MDRAKLIDAAPSGEAVQVSEVCHYAEVILAAIAEEGREPDDWEAGDLVTALGYLHVGQRMAAVTFLQRSVEPPERRSPIWRGRVVTYPSAKDLSAAFTDARNQ